jgi:hypothetical protein
VGEAAFGAQAPAESELVGGRDHADGGSGDKGDVGEISKWRSQRDHLLDTVGAALRQDLRKQPAPAVPYQRHSGAVLLLDLRNTVTEAGKHVLRMESVQVDARQVRLVPDSSEPAVKQAHRPIAGKEPGHQQH